jgi:hypothetical protein
MNTTALQSIIEARIQAKRAEDEAIKVRRELDAQLADLLKDPNKQEGSVSQKVEGYKVTVVYKLDRKVDGDELQNSWDKIPAEVQKAFKWSPTLSVSAYRELDDKAQKIVTKYVTTKEATPSVKIEAV